jgi:hypothetical protein
MTSAARHIRRVRTLWLSLSQAHGDFACLPSHVVLQICITRQSNVVERINYLAHRLRYAFRLV